MFDMPFTSHDCAYLATPTPVAVTRVTLQTWYEPDPSTCPSRVAGFPPLAACMRDACLWISSEIPDCTHGLLVHAVQRATYEPARPPSLTTVQQYATRWARVKVIIMPAFGGAPQSVLLTLDGGAVPKWVWHHLSGALVSPAKTGGDLPVPADTATTQDPPLQGALAEQPDRLLRFLGRGC